LLGLCGDVETRYCKQNGSIWVDGLLSGLKQC